MQAQAPCAGCRFHNFRALQTWGVVALCWAKL